MFCDEALDAVEPIAAGDLTPEGRVADHLATCPQCAAALAHARTVDALLRARPAPRPPLPFTTRTLARVRRAHWTSDQRLDAVFNLAVGLIALGVVAAVWLLLNRSGLTAVSSDVVTLFGTGLVAFAHRVAPSLPLYAAATALLASALGVWWWAERDNLT